MKSPAHILIILIAAITCVAEAQNSRIQIPSDPKLEELYALHPDRIENPLKILIDNTKEPKNHEFISASGATKNLKWRASSIIIVSPEVVAIKYDEGHIQVVGIYTWNSEHKQWVVSTEYGGTLRERAYAATKNNSAEQAAPSNR